MVYCGSPSPQAAIRTIRNLIASSFSTLARKLKQIPSLQNAVEWNVLRQVPGSKVPGPTQRRSSFFFGGGDEIIPRTPDQPEPTSMLVFPFSSFMFILTRDGKHARRPKGRCVGVVSVLCRCWSVATHPLHVGDSYHLPSALIW